MRGDFQPLYPPLYVTHIQHYPCSFRTTPSLDHSPPAPVHTLSPLPGGSSLLPLVLQWVGPSTLHLLTAGEDDPDISPDDRDSITARLAELAAMAVFTGVFPSGVRVVGEGFWEGGQGLALSRGWGVEAGANCCDWFIHGA